MTTPTRSAFLLYPTSSPTKVHHDSPIMSRYSIIVSRAYSVVAGNDLVLLPSLTATDIRLDESKCDPYKVADSIERWYLARLPMREQERAQSWPNARMIPVFA